MRSNKETTSDSENQKKNNQCAIVFRNRCHLGPALERRILRWSRSLSARPEGQRCDIWVSSDLSSVHDDNPKTDTVQQMEFTEMSANQSVQILTEIREENYMWRSLPENKIIKWWLHSYTVHNVASAFPHIRSLDKLCERFLGWGYCEVWARIYQTEFILLWMNATQEQGFHQYSHVWVMQDDVEYTGDPAEFLFSPAFSNSDFVSPHGILPIRSKQIAQKISTLPFARNYESGNLYFAGEGVRRYSWDFLTLLYDRAILGESAWSELSAPSICKYYSDRCKSMRFPRNAFSAKWAWEDQTECILSAVQLDQKLRWWETRRDHSDIWQDRWVHKVVDSNAPVLVGGTCIEREGLVREALPMPSLASVVAEDWSGNQFAQDWLGNQLISFCVIIAVFSLVYLFTRIRNGLKMSSKILAFHGNGKCCTKVGLGCCRYKQQKNGVTTLDKNTV